MITQNILTKITNLATNYSRVNEIFQANSTPTESSRPCILNWIEQGNACQAIYSDELGVVEFKINTEAPTHPHGINLYRMSYQYKAPSGILIAKGTWETRETIEQAKQLAESQLQQFL